MAVAAVYEYPDLGCVVRVHDDKLLPDMAAGWDAAYKVAGEIYFRHLREEMERKAKEEQTA